MSTDTAARTHEAVSTLIHALPPRPQAYWVDFLEGLPAKVREAAQQGKMRAEAIADVVARAARPERMPHQERDQLPASFYREAIYEHLEGLARDIDEVSE